MDSKLDLILRSLQTIRNRLDDYIYDRGGDTDGAMTIYDLVNRIGTIPNDIEHVRSGYQLFEGNTVMTQFPRLIKPWNFTSAYRMCYGCTALEEVDECDLRNATNCMYAFYGCSNLRIIHYLNTDNATSVSEMFHGCKSLVRIGSWVDFSNVSSQMDTTFTSCSALQEIRFKGTIKADLWVNGCSNLSVDSLLSILEALKDFSTTGGTHKLTLGTRNKAKLTAEQLAIATNKGWTLP